MNRLREAVTELFRSNLAASQAILRDYVGGHPRDPLGFSLTAAVPFYHAVGSGLGSQSGGFQKALISKPLTLPPGVADEIGAALKKASVLAKVDLEANPRDENALLALCVSEGVWRDAQALVFRRWTTSMEHARVASEKARALLAANPRAYDAYFVIGFSEHMVAHIPRVFRPFTKIPGIVGQSQRAIQFLAAAGDSGEYLRDFARQMLAVVYTEEGRVAEAVGVLEGLVTDFPEHVGYRAELERLRRVAQPR